VARSRHGAQERPLDLFRGPTSKEAHQILHRRAVTGQGDLAIFASKPELLLRHPQELAEHVRAEVHQRDLKAPAVGRVHDAVALASHRC
jgi:hypothetical protein